MSSKIFSPLDIGVTIQEGWELILFHRRLFSSTSSTFVPTYFPAFSFSVCLLYFLYRFGYYVIRKPLDYATVRENPVEIDCTLRMRRGFVAEIRVFLSTVRADPDDGLCDRLYPIVVVKNT